MKRKIISFVIGLVIGLPLTTYAVNHQEPSPLPVHYDSGLFEQFNVSEESVESDEESDEYIIHTMTPEEIEEEMYFDSLELLALCVESEAGNQGLIGKKYVVDVVLNRVDDPDFPDNITDVIFQKNAFSVVNDGRIYEADPTDETFQAVTEELECRTNDEVLFFTSEGFSEYGTDWKKIGDHYFSRK